MKSVMREVQPDLIIFHHEVLPVVVKWIYNTWFDELRKEFPGQADKEYVSNLKNKSRFYICELTKHGGIYGMRKYDFLKD